VQRVEVITSHSSKQPLKIPTKQSIADPSGNQCLKIKLKERKKEEENKCKEAHMHKSFVCRSVIPLVNNPENSNQTIHC
jgi:hypothetical protein